MRQPPSHAIACIAMFTAIVCRPTVAAEKPTILDVSVIWDASPHNAFTDLTRHQGRWYCAFREGQGHVSHDGAVRILTSDSGRDWRSAARLTSPGPLPDLRDAKLSVTPTGQLMVVAAAADRRQKPSQHQTYAWFSDNGETWSKPVPIGEADHWLWRVTWHNKKAYAVGYHTAGERYIRLYRSDDGKRFDVLAPRLVSDGYPNETSLWFEGDTALCLLRRDGRPNQAMLGRSKAPFTEWTWTDLQHRIGGPHMIRLPDGRFIVAGRRYDGKVRTSLMWLEQALDSQPPVLRELLTLPSGGDTSYPGLVWHDDQLWVSYYASHEGKANIYLARITIPPRQAENKQDASRE